MIGGLMASKYFYFLVFRTCEYVLLHGKLIDEIVALNELFLL